MNFQEVNGYSFLKARLKGSEMNYSEKLRDPRWQKKRLEIFERDSWACRYCGDKENTLAIHHTYYSNDLSPWEYPDDSLITVCERCHSCLTQLQILKDSWMMWFQMRIETTEIIHYPAPDESNGINKHLWGVIKWTFDNPYHLKKIINFIESLDSKWLGDNGKTE